GGIAQEAESLEPALLRVIELQLRHARGLAGFHVPVAVREDADVHIRLVQLAAAARRGAHADGSEVLHRDGNEAEPVALVDRREAIRMQVAARAAYDDPGHRGASLLATRRPSRWSDRRCGLEGNLRHHDGIVAHLRDAWPHRRSV